MPNDRHHTRDRIKHKHKHHKNITKLLGSLRPGQVIYLEEVPLFRYVKINNYTYYLLDKDNKPMNNSLSYSAGILIAAMNVSVNIHKCNLIVEDIRLNANDLQNEYNLRKEDK